MLTRLQRCVAHPKQSRAVLAPTKLLLPLQTVSISSKNNSLPYRQATRVQAAPTRAFSSQEKDSELEAVAAEVVEPVEEVAPVEQAEEALSPIEDLIVGEEAVAKGLSDAEASEARETDVETEGGHSAENYGIIQEKVHKMYEHDYNMYFYHQSRRPEPISNFEMNLASKGKVDILKQVVTDPDYAAREQFLEGQSPRAITAKEEKARALSKLAAYNKSAEILKHIKTRLGSDETMKHYMANELSKTGTEFGKFMAKEMGQDTTQAGEIQSNSLKFKKKVKKGEELRANANSAVDSHAFGMSGQFGSRSFAPSAKGDRLPKHDKNQIASFKEYQDHMQKIKEQSEDLSEFARRQRYDEIFDRYKIPMIERKYAFLSEIGKLDPNDREFAKKMQDFDKLAKKIPELYFEAVRPTVDDVVEFNLTQIHKHEMAHLSQIQMARDVYVEKNMSKHRAAFEKKNASMSEADRQAAWTTFEENLLQGLTLDTNKRVQEFWKKAEGRIEGAIREMPDYNKTATEIMTQSRYQAVKEDGPLSIDRVSQDGPRDFFGDLKDSLKDGPVYDQSKPPQNFPITNLEQLSLEGQTYGQPAKTHSNPVERALNEAIGLREHLEENFDYAKELETAIDQSRRQLAENILKLQKNLTKAQKQKENLEEFIKTDHFRYAEQQVIPSQNVLEYVEFEAQQASNDHTKLLKDELKNLLKSKKELDSKSTDPKTYEAELKVLSTHALLNQALGTPNDQLDLFTFVFGQIADNKVPFTPQIDARLFEYSVLGGRTQLANSTLVKLTKDRSESLSPVDPRFLSKFFEQSLQKDNLDGVAHLVNYSERYGTDTSSLPINNFRAALDFYLNKKFDLSKIMTFMKFYQVHFSDRARREFDKVEPSQQELSKETIHSVSKSVFGNSDGLVDLPVLAEYLVQNVGKRQVIDPFSGEDSLWKFFEGQTMDKDFVRAASMSDHCKIDGRTVGKYLGNQFERPSSFDRTFRTALRLDGTPMAGPFFKEVMKQLNDYSLKNQNRLPGSFTKQKLNDLYLRLKLSGTSLSPAMSELLLVSLSRQGMHQEVIDYCTAEGKQMTDVEKYYLAESLLQGKLGEQTRVQAMKKGKIFADGKDLSACELTLKTKALFLDGSAKAAIDSFKEDLAKREAQAAKRKELMVALYDSAMPTDRTLTFEEFKAKHKKSALFTKRIVQQAFIVNNLQKIVRGNDYDGIDNAFNLYMVMSQERELLGTKFTLDDKDCPIEVGAVAKISSKQREQLDLLRERRAHLKQLLHAEDYYRIQELLEVSNGSQLDAMSELDSQGIQRVLDTFGEITFEDVMRQNVTIDDEAEDEGTSRQTKQDRVKNMRRSIRSAKSIEQVMEAAEKEREFDWFAAFANKKAAKHEKTLSEIIIENTRHLQPPKAERKKMSKAELGAHLLETYNNRDFINMSEADRAEYIKDMEDLQKRYQDEKLLGAEYNEVNEATLVKEEEDLLKLQEEIEKIIDAFDEDKENELMAKVNLDSKLSVLREELCEDRFANVENVNEKEAFSYAQTIALMRLEAREIEESLVKLKEKAFKENPSSEYKRIYNMDESVQDGEDMVASKLMEEAKDPAAIVDYFRTNYGNREAMLTLTEELETAQILPAALKEVEQKAIKSANTIFKKKGGQQEDKDKKPKEIKITANSSWEDVLRQSENLHADGAYTYYFYGKRGSNSGQVQHPRELFDEMCKPHVSEEVALLHNSRLLGLDAYDDDCGSSETDYDDDEDAEAEREDRKQLDYAMAEIRKKYSRIIEHPLAEFQGRRMLNISTLLRERQSRITRNYEQDTPDGAKEMWGDLESYSKRILEDPIDPADTYDPINAQAEAHNMSLLDLKEGLTKAVGERKEQALPLAIQIFNRIQEKTVSVTRLDNFAQKSAEGESTQEINNVTEALDNLERLLNDSSSPIISTLRATSKYSVDKLPETIDEFRATVKNGDILNNAVDLNRIINDYKTVGKTADTVSEIEKTLGRIEKSLSQKQKKLKEKASKDSYDQFMQEAKEKTLASQENELRRLYAAYKTQQADVSDDQKIRLMRDVLQVQLGDDFVNSDVGKAHSSFPAFYAQDLIHFGLKKKIPASVRLGELLLAENCEGHGQAVMPRALAQAVKDFMFDHQEKYSDAAKITGPINNTVIYHQARQVEGEQPVSMAVDDPYWAQWMDKNYRREDNWRAPSAMAWDHKHNGILGEVLDFSRSEKTTKEQQMKL